MTVLSVRIQEIEDKDKPLIPEFLDGKTKQIFHGNLQIFCILEKGTAAGDSSVSFSARSEDGTAITLETTGKLMHSMYAAFVGAEQRFLDKKINKDNG